MTTIAQYEALCDAVNVTIKRDVATVGMKWRAVVDVEAFVSWVKGKLAEFGMRSASEHCNRGDLAEYATWVAREIMMKADPGYPEFATASIITGPDEADYWRAVTIASEMIERKNKGF